MGEKRHLFECDGIGCCLHYCGHKGCLLKGKFIQAWAVTQPCGRDVLWRKVRKGREDLAVMDGSPGKRGHLPFLSPWMGGVEATWAPILLGAPFTVPVMKLSEDRGCSPWGSRCAWFKVCSRYSFVDNFEFPFWVISARLAGFPIDQWLMWLEVIQTELQST